VHAMVLYARHDPLRSRQIATDALVAGWVALWVWLATRVHDLVGRLAGPGEDVEGAGRSLADAAGRGADVPLVGRAFEAVADGGRALGRAGARQQEAVADLAVVLGLVVAAVPVAWLLLRWLPARARWVHEATAAAAVLDAGGDERLFALRALATAPLPALRRAADDPLGAYDRGDVAALADLELRRLGLRGGRLSSTGTRL